jgi:hypothetical protein
MVKLSYVATRAIRASVVAVLMLIALAAVAAVPFTPPFGKWTRLSLDPIESPRGEGFESAGTFNPSLVEKNGKYVVLYRAQVIIPGYKGKWNVKWTKSGAIVPEKINGKY